MTLLQIVVLAIVQGITEFLPISSSGHLILVPQLTGWTDQGLMMDVGVHVGTLAAVMIYFRKDVGALLHAFWQMLSLSKSHKPHERKLFLALILATVPVVVFGGLVSVFDLNDLWRTAEVIGWTSIIFGILLYVLDMRSPVTKTILELRYGHALIMGLAQVLALIPGTSRSGITMTAARGLGFSRTEAARFSMLMSIPTILAAGTLEGLKLVESGDFVLGQDVLVGAVLSFIAALLAIAGLMKWLQSASMTPFVIYRVLLGAGLLIWVYA
ncbi:undecaprenyl-diphosphate phosphatase [Emcibacter sp.]|uniref:undecaprenyl-diphosphate phosphatase n=1 Tax=Emcibacter sp. TaxID=1979954 RepID=UPI002AA78D08|nr:undecaprenyl-diphosphate phosphatase [Emcibacter sp.]